MKISIFSFLYIPPIGGLWLAVFFLGLLPQAGNAEPSAHKELPYALDEISREIPPRGRVQCPSVPIVRYEGRILPYHRPLKVYEGFRDRLEKFEAVVRDTAIEIYGRAPRKIVHMGTYNCRRIRGYPNLVSEHGLGNGIDIEGFDFGRLPAGVEAPEGLPKRLLKPFKVRLLRHWNSKRGPAKVHARFLRTLAKRLIEGEEIFRVLLGPAFPGHKNHFHFDCAPYRMVEIF